MPTDPPPHPETLVLAGKVVPSFRMVQRLLQSIAPAHPEDIGKRHLVEVVPGCEFEIIGVRGPVEGTAVWLCPSAFFIEPPLS